MKYGELQLGQIEAMVNKLGGMDGVRKFLAGGLAISGSNTWPTWRTLAIGGVSRDEFLRRMKDRGIYVSDWARNIMDNPGFTTLAKVKRVRLGRAKVSDLGFTTEPTTTELFARIKEVGDLCPAEVGPHVRLDDRDQLHGTWYWIAMEPITDSAGHPDVFSVDRGDDGEQWLDAYYADPADRWDLSNVVVFLLRK